MVSGGRLDGGTQVISLRVRRTIQSIKEIVGNHSDADIYDTLKESNMDPNETAQKLLNQDPFHEVKRKRDKRKENMAYRVYAERQILSEYNIHQAKPYMLRDRNAWRGSQARKIGPGINREFRIVRDNRVNQKAVLDQDSNRDAKTEPVQSSSSSNQQMIQNFTEKSSTGVFTGQKHSAAKTSEGHLLSQGWNKHSDSGSGHPKNAELSGGQRPAEAKGVPLPDSARLASEEGQNNSQKFSATSGSMTSHIGVYSSSSDPVHVPSPDSRSAGAIGAIGREVRAVGGRRPTSDCHPSVSNSSLSIPQLGKEILSSKESFGPSVSTSKSPSHTPNFELANQNMPPSKALPPTHYNARLQQSAAHQKATQPTMEWKPKTSQKPVVSGGVIGMPSLSASGPNNSTGADLIDVAGTADKVSQINISEDEHVIIPHHLRVPESERTRLTFGSFGAGFESIKAAASCGTSRNAEELCDGSAVSSISASVPVTPGEDDSADDQTDLVGSQGRNSPSESPESGAESEQPQPGNDESSSPPNMDAYADIDLVQVHNSSYISSEPQQLQSSPSLPSFSPLNSHTISSSRLSVSMAQQLVQQQQHQPVAQMYPQVHISHLPNFVPYRHMFSPVYAPPVAMPNYSSNPAFAHPSSANSYLLVPGGTSHINAAAAAAKYATSQYKPVPTGSLSGYGNFNNPAGYTIPTQGTIGNTASLDDASRIKYKDNIYAANPQGEAPDIWIQTPRELTNMASAPYYNLTGQAPQPAFLPAHAGHAAFNATAQPPHVQYPGLYHPTQAASIPNAHHLVHQQVPPALGGSVGVSVAAPGPQVGAYQQPQMGHLNWSANF